MSDYNCQYEDMYATSMKYLVVNSISCEHINKCRNMYDFIKDKVK